MSSLLLPSSRLVDMGSLVLILASNTARAYRCSSLQYLLLPAAPLCRHTHHLRDEEERIKPAAPCIILTIFASLYRCVPV